MTVRSQVLFTADGVRIDAGHFEGDLLFGGTAVRFPLDVSIVECYADAA